MSRSVLKNLSELGEYAIDITLALLGGAAFAAGITIPLEHVLKGDWTIALSFWAVPAIVAIIFWLIQSPKYTTTNNQCVVRVNGFLGCLIASLKSVWLWSIILGIGQGALTSISMAMIVLRSENTHVASKLSSMVQSIGFSVGAFGPLLIGLVYQSPNHFISVEIALIVISVALLYFGFKAGRNLYVSANIG